MLKCDSDKKIPAGWPHWINKEKITMHSGPLCHTFRSVMFIKYYAASYHRDILSFTSDESAPSSYKWCLFELVHELPSEKRMGE